MFKKAAVGVGAVVGGIGSALAAVSTEVTTAMSEGKADALTVAGLSLVIIIAIAAIKYSRRAV